YTCGKLLCLLLLLAHIVACLWWLLGGVDANNIKTDDHNGADTEYWPFKFSHQFTDSNLTPYAHSMFYSIGMMTTFGFFDISPSNTLERSFTMAIMLISGVVEYHSPHLHCPTLVACIIVQVHYAPMDIVYYKGDLGNSTYWITSVKIREIGRDDLDKMASNKDRDPRTSVLGGVANAALGRWATDGYADNNNNLLAGVPLAVMGPLRECGRRSRRGGRRRATLLSMVAHRMGGNVARMNPAIGDSMRYTLGDDGADDDDGDV
ncbi:hypothetical protein FOL46_009771, partial [Perkinsus olseni]